MIWLMAVLASAASAGIFCVGANWIESFGLEGDFSALVVVPLCILYAFTRWILPFFDEDASSNIGLFCIRLAVVEFSITAILIIIWFVLLCAEIKMPELFLTILGNYFAVSFGNLAPFGFLGIEYREQKRYERMLNSQNKQALKIDKRHESVFNLQAKQAPQFDISYRIRRMKKTVEQIIDKLESEIDDFKPSCKTVLMNALIPRINNSQEAAKTWESDYDYIKSAYMAIYLTTFDMLTSGRFHIYRGSLDPMNESTHLYKLFIKSLEWYCKNGYATKEQMLEQIEILKEMISEVG